MAWIYRFWKEREELQLSKKGGFLYYATTLVFAGSILVVGSQFSMSNKLYTVVAVNKGVSRVTSGRDGADDEEDMPNDRLEQLIMEYLE